MSGYGRRVCRWLAIAAISASAGCEPAPSVDGGVQLAGRTSVPLSPPQGQTREVDFTTDEGTWMALDVAPDGRWLVFDLLGQVYRLPIDGGAATNLTEGSGNALNFHPAISRDGASIAYISDRLGQNNVWVMDADGSNARPVLLDLDTRFMHPAWAPDGRSVVAVRLYPTPGRGWHRQTSELWRLPLEGGAPEKLLGSRLTHYDAPSFAPDGKHLYFHVSYSTGDGLGLLTAGHRLQRLDLSTGRVENVRTMESAELTAEFITALRRTGYSADNAIDPPAAVTPALSPDGSRVAFGLEQAGKPMTWRGHEYTPRTALVMRSLADGAERTLLDPAAKDLTMVNAQYAYGVFPRFAWMPDGQSLVAWEGGKIRRVDLATGAVATIPFTARVKRTLSAMARGSRTIDDSLVTSRFLQWPAGSPDGGRLAFVAFGSVWTTDLPAGPPRRLTAEMPGTVQLTPAWSRDGAHLAFATWHDSARGHVWVVDAKGGLPRQVTTEGGEYLHPLWSHDGKTLFVTLGPGAPPNGNWHGWNTLRGWQVVAIPVDGGVSRVVTQLSGPHRVALSADGTRLQFQFQERANDAPGLLYYPFPSDSALALTIRARSSDLTGGDLRDHAVLPAGRGKGSEPVLSPGGRWVAHHAGRFIHVSPVTPAAAGAAPVIINDPNEASAGRVRVFDAGGVHASWRDSITLQFASGARYITYDAFHGTTTVRPVQLKVPQPRAGGTIALTNARLITIDSAGVIERGMITVRGSRITCVGTVGACDTTGVERVIDLAGKTIIPGLVDVHAHHATETGGVVTPHRTASALDIAYGVTTTLDPSTDSESAFPLAEMIEAGVVLGPRTFSVGEIVIHPGAAWGEQLIIRNQADADREVDRRADWGAASIKNFRQAARYQQQLLLNAARRRGVTVTSEGGPLYFDVGLVLDGQAGWEHFIANVPIYKDVATFFGQAGIVYSPTSIVAGHVLGSMQWYRQQQRLADDPKYRRFMAAAELAQRYALVQPVPKSAFSFPIIAEGLADIVRAGGRGALGEHGEQPGIGTHWELWAYAEALSPLEALKVATIDGAWFIGLERETGSLAAGKLADLVVLNGDPRRDIRRTADIVWVMKAGRLYDDETLSEVWPTQRRYLPVPWQ